MLSATLFIVGLMIVIVAFDLLRRWWRENEWKRHWRRRGPDGE